MFGNLRKIRKKYKNRRKIRIKYKNRRNWLEKQLWDNNSFVFERGSVILKSIVHAKDNAIEWSRLHERNYMLYMCTYVCTDEPANRLVPFVWSTEVRFIVLFYVVKTKCQPWKRLLWYAPRTRKWPTFTAKLSYLASFS